MLDTTSSARSARERKCIARGPPAGTDLPKVSAGRLSLAGRGGELGLDHFGEGLEGPRAGDHPTVDEVGRRAAHAHPGTVLQVLLHLGMVTVRGEACAERLLVETHTLAAGGEVCRAEVPRLGHESAVV